MGNQAGDKTYEDQKAQLQQQLELAGLQKSTAEARKAEAEAQKAAVEAQQAALAAALPKGETKPLAGTITAEGDKFGYPAELVAYQCLHMIAQKIGSAISKAPKLPGVSEARILIVPERSVAAGDIPLLQLQTQLQIFDKLLAAQEERESSLSDQLRRELERVSLAAGEEEGIPKAELEVMAENGFAAAAAASVAVPFVPPVISAALVAAPAVASLLADLAGYLKSDYTISGQAVELSYEALSAAVAGAITDRAVYLLNFHFLDGCWLVSQVVELVVRRHKLEEINLQLKQQVTAAPGAAAGAARVAAAVAETESLLKAFDDFIKVISTPVNETTPPLLVQAALRQTLREKQITHLLHLKVVSSGGEAMTRRRLFSSGEMAFIGGCAVAYVLADVTGAVALADTQAGMAQLDLELSDPTRARIQPISLE